MWNMDHHEGKRKRSDLEQSVCIIIQQSQTLLVALFSIRKLSSQLRACPERRQWEELLGGAVWFLHGVLIRPRQP